MTAGLSSGSRIGPYEVVGPIGAGGMGEVYRARDPRLQRDVAIKVLPASFAQDPERVQRFEREARILAALDHTHIAAIYGLEDAAGSKALVLEFIEGPTLAERIERGPLELQEVLTIARQIADALECAHEQGIIHRDLKPANIKVRSDGTVKVLDFGLARAGGATAADMLDAPTLTAVATKEGTVMGTVAYMSPEQARGQAVDRRTDIWAFGCVLFEMLARERPFSGPSTPDTIANILQRDPDWLRLPTDTPAPLRDLLRLCLQKDARRRLRDIGDARIALEDWQTGTLPRELPASTGMPARRRAVAFVLTASLAGAAGILVDRGYQTWRRPAAPPEFGRFTRLVASNAHETAPVISPDGKWVAYLSNARGPVDVWVKFVGSGEAINLTEKLTDISVQSQDAIGGLAVSPDGLQLAVSAGPPGARPAELATWVIDAPLGGIPRRAARGQGMKWSRDGTRIAYVLPGGTSGDSIAVADADGQNERVVLQRQGGGHAHWLNWSHDGTYLYYMTARNNVNAAPLEIARVAAAGGPVETIIRTPRRAMFPTPTPSGDGLIYAANPDAVDNGLWWRDLRSGRDHRLTSGIGEYGSTSLSADGNRLVAVSSTAQQSLYRVSIRFDRPVVLEPLTEGSSGDIDPCTSPDGTRIVFSSLRNGNRNIWSARADLSQAVQLTSGPWIDERPAYSPDGRRVAFVSDRGGRRGIWGVGTDGGGLTRIADVPVLDYLSWSVDGRRIVYSQPGENVARLAVVDVASGVSTPLPETDSATSPAWSPTEDLIAHVSTKQGGGASLAFVSSDGRPQPLLDDKITGIGGGILAWSPDGRRLAGVGLPGSRNGFVWIIEPRGKIPFQKLIDLPPDVRVRGVTWTHDGSAIVIGHVRSTGDIVIADRLR